MAKLIVGAQDKFNFDYNKHHRRRGPSVCLYCNYCIDDVIDNVCGMLFSILWFGGEILHLDLFWWYASFMNQNWALAQLTLHPLLQCMFVWHAIMGFIDGFVWCTTYLALGLQALPNSTTKRASRPKYFTHHANPPFKPITKIFNGHVRGGSVRNYFSVRTILNSTNCCEWLWYESSNRGLPCGEIGKWVTWHTKLRPNEPEYAIFVLYTTRLYYKALGILCDFLTNTPQLESFWRWPLWRYKSPQNVSFGTTGVMVTTHEIP